MPPKVPVTQNEKQPYVRSSFPLTKVPYSSFKRTSKTIAVRPPEKIPRKVLDFFKMDVKSGSLLNEEKRSFLAQVLMHEIDEGIRILQQCGREEQSRLLKISNPRMHLSNQILLLREWLGQDPIRNRPPERVARSLKLRNSQNGELTETLPHGRALGFTSHGILYKDRNEDALLIVPEREVLAVFDGMGGHIGGNIASGIAVDFLEYGLKQGMTLEKATVLANEAILQRTRNDPSLGGMTPMGTTLACCEIKGSLLKVLHVGDSKLLVIRDGKIIYESQDHTNGQDLLREGLVDHETAHYLNHILSRSLGCDSILVNRDLERSEIALKPGDRILLATDGITDNYYTHNFSLAELTQLASLNALDEAVSKIYDVCLDRIRKGTLPNGQAAKPDNLTLLLYQHGL
jgi:serine/threonine protein phosphatase PrpC